MKQLFKYEEIDGKTIVRSVISTDQLWLRFSDKSFIVFETESDSDGFGYSRDNIRVCEDVIDNTYPELVEIGFITTAQNIYATQDQERKWEAEQEQRQIRENLKREDEQRQMFIELSKKFGK